MDESDSRLHPKVISRPFRSLRFDCNVESSGRGKVGYFLVLVRAVRCELLYSFASIGRIVVRSF